MNEALMDEISEQREIRKEVYAICCPFCGKYHYKMFEGHGMFTCEKCKRNVEFIVSDGRVTLFAEESLDKTGRDTADAMKMPRMKARHSAGMSKAGRGYSLGRYSGCMSEG